MSRLARRAISLLLAVSLPLSAGCFAPKYFGVGKVYDSKFTASYAGVYDAAVIAHGYPLPLILGLQLKPGDVGYEIITTTTIPIAALVSVIGGTLALIPVMLLFD